MKLSHIAKSQWYTYCCSLSFFFCIFYTSTDSWGCHCAPYRRLEQRRTSAITRWESAIFMSDWTWVEKKPKSIQVTMQCCVSSTRGSSQPSRSPPRRLADGTSFLNIRTDSWPFFLPWENRREIIGAAAGGPAVKLHPDHFYLKRKKSVGTRSTSWWVSLLWWSPEGVTAMLSWLNYPPC